MVNQNVWLVCQQKKGIVFFSMHFFASTGTLKVDAFSYHGYIDFKTVRFIELLHIYDRKMVEDALPIVCMVCQFGGDMLSNGLSGICEAAVGKMLYL